MRSIVSVPVFGTIAILVLAATTANAEPGRCKAAIARSSTAFIQAKAAALQNCEKDIVLGKLPAATDCHGEPKAAGKIAKAEAKLRSTIAKSCGGADKVCGTPGDDPPGAVGWGGVCPNFENGSCTNAISHCGDIADCLLCIGEAAVDQALTLYYDAFVPSAPSSEVNRCQREIGRSTTNFLRSKSKALAQCWLNVNLGRGTEPCPVPGDGRAGNAIAKAEARKITNICFACGGDDEACNGVGDLTPAEIGFVGSCPAVTVPGGGSCAGAITTLQNIVDCVDCVTEFKVDCTDRAAVPWNAGGYPAECNPGAMVTPTRTATPNVTPTATRTATPSPTATVTGAVTATRTPTPSPTATNVLTATPTATATNVLTATPTVTATSAVTATRTATPSPTVTATGVLTATRTVTPTPTVTATRTATATPVVTATRTATPTVTATVVAPTATRTPTPTPTSTGGLCGNGVLNAGEDCDPAGGAATSCQTASNTSASITCNPTTCQCACPTRVTFTGDPNDPLSILDTGWTGISHRAPIISNGDVTIGLSGCAGSSRPCGTCNLSGPVVNPNAGAGQLDNRRCTNDTSIRCTSNTPCTAGGGTCEFFFGSSLPLAAGGVTTCVVNQFFGSITGTANIESGEANTVANLRARVYTGVAIDNPCPRCVGDAAINDGLQNGTCDAGLRVGLACDGNGTVANRPDFGTTSLDCTQAAGGIIATLPIDLSNKTDPVVRTLTTASPNCSGSAGEKCLCDTCNNGGAEICTSNADCPANGGGTGICGGLRCIGGADAGQVCQTCVGGTNHGGGCFSATACPGGGTCPNPRQCVAGSNMGTGCSNNSQCPGSTCATTCAGGQCNRPGEPTKPSACLDDPSTPNELDCFDDGSGEGTCAVGPVDNNCSVASGHAQRGCSFDSDCGGVGGSCETTNRRCFLTGGGTFQAGARAGTDTLIAVGMEDAPMNDVSNPTLGAVFCVGPTGSSSVNNVAGLPGPGRVTIRGTAVGLP